MGQGDIFTWDLLAQLNGGEAGRDVSQGMQQSAALPIPALLGQSGCARCIGMLIGDGDKKVAKELLSLDVIRNLLFAAGNAKFTTNPDIWTELSQVDTDILLNNRASMSPAEVASMLPEETVERAPINKFMN